ncbi:MAG: hypothetical protein AAF938_27180, partial [Myxococcota bacterium]
ADPSDPDYDPQGVQAMRDVELDEGEARNHFRIAQALYEGGRFLEAAQEFEEAHRLSARPSMLFNAYLAYRDAGRLNDSLRALEGYLDGAPDAEDAARLSARARAMRRSLEEQAAEQQAEEAERERLAAEAAAAEARAEQEAARAAEAQQRAAEAEGRPSPVGWVVAGTGVAALIAGGVTAAAASSRFSDLESSCPDGFCPQDFDLDGEQSSTLRLQRTTDALLYSGAALTVAGVVLLLVLKRGGNQAPTASCTDDGCSFGMQGVF